MTRMEGEGEKSAGGDSDEERALAITRMERALAAKNGWGVEGEKERSVDGE